MLYDVFKYKLSDTRVSLKTTIEVLPGAEFLSVGKQGDDVVVWFRVDRGAQGRKESRTFVVCGTGTQDAPGPDHEYRGTVQFGYPGGNLVLHIFEAKRS